MKHRLKLSLVYPMLLVVLDSGVCGAQDSMRNPPAVEASGFKYDPTSGQCKSPQGTIGLNIASRQDIVALIKKSRLTTSGATPGAGVFYRSVSLECMDLRDIDFSHIVGTSYPTMQGFNFRGANLAGGKLKFLNVVDGQFEGAALKGMTLGYVTLNGSVDSFTTLPTGGCVVSGKSLQCRK